MGLLLVLVGTVLVVAVPGFERRNSRQMKKGGGWSGRSGLGEKVSGRFNSKSRDKNNREIENKKSRGKKGKECKKGSNSRLKKEGMIAYLVLVSGQGMIGLAPESPELAPQDAGIGLVYTRHRDHPDFYDILSDQLLNLKSVYLRLTTITPIAISVPTPPCTSSGCRDLSLTTHLMLPGSLSILPLLRRSIDDDRSLFHW